MAWWSRPARWIRRVVRGTEPLPPPRPSPKPRPRPAPPAPAPRPRPAPPRPTFDPLAWIGGQPEPEQPTDTGDWPAGLLYSQQDYDIPGDEIAGYVPIYDDSYLYGGEPDDTVILYDQNLQPIEYDKVTGQPVSFTGDQWYSETFHSQEYLLERYGIDNLDILRALEEAGYIDDDDWATWREYYGSMFG